MNSWRLLLALFLLAGIASAQDHAELRKLINGYRNTVERQRVELVLPKRVAAVPAGAVLSIGFRGTLLWLDPVGDRVCITQLRHGISLRPDLRTGSIRREQFEALVADQVGDHRAAEAQGGRTT